MKHLIYIFLLFVLPLSSVAEEEAVTADSDSLGLAVEVDALAFFRDNEYDSHLTNGYSLPGAWLRPALIYNPNSSIHLEAGFHALFFDGANKYPNYAYHDIATWKGNQYQSGAHVLPWFRAEARKGAFTVVLGNIYGSLYHQHITPLYNREQLLSADPEMGAQIIINSGRLHTDLYLNWQSYQFEEDTHQEAFTVGLSARLNIARELSATAHMLVQHRGGEQDITDMGVQTLCNGSLGLQWQHGMRGTVSALRAQANILGCYQQAGKLWHFDSGMALHGEIGVDMLRGLTMTVGCMHAPRNFISLYGSPFFSTVGMKTDRKSYDGITTGYLNLDYHLNFGTRYCLGANIETFKVNSTGLDEFNFSFGLYMRVTPWFKL